MEGWYGQRLQQHVKYQSFFILELHAALCEYANVVACMPSELSRPILEFFYA